MREHELKTWPHPFRAVWDGSKTHEVRVNDRDFRVTDLLVLREWDPAHRGGGVIHDGGSSTSARWADPVPRGYTGRKIRVRVTHLTPGGAFGLPPNLCVMSIAVVEREEWT